MLLQIYAHIIFHVIAENTPVAELTYYYHYYYYMTITLQMFHAFQSVDVHLEKKKNKSLCHVCTVEVNRIFLWLK